MLRVRGEGNVDTGALDGWCRGHAPGCCVALRYVNGVRARCSHQGDIARRQVNAMPTHKAIVEDEFHDAFACFFDQIQYMFKPLLPTELGGPGYGFGLGFGVRLVEGMGWAPESKGDAMWASAWVTSFWIDPKEKLVGIFMAQGLSIRVQTRNYKRLGLWWARKVEKLAEVLNLNNLSYRSIVAGQYKNAKVPYQKHIESPDPQA
jgi:hypothetical protein